MVKSIIWTKKRVIACLLTAVLAVGCLPFFEKGSLAEGESGGLQPVPNYYDKNGVMVDSSEDAALTLSKTAVRIAADQWRVTVSATIDDTPIERQKMEVVFVLDASGSMEFCTDMAEHSKSQSNHDHNNNCRVICGRTIHVHNSNCYASTNSCGLAEHEHSLISPCYKECSRSNNSSHYEWFWNSYRHKEGTSCYTVSNDGFTKYYYLNCTNSSHNHYVISDCYSECSQNTSGSQKVTINNSDKYFSQNCNQVSHTHSGACKKLICTKDEHEHTSSCYSCGKVDGNHSPGGGNPCTYQVKENGSWQTKYYKSRLEVAKNTINGMINNLQTEMGNNVSIRYVIFSSHYYTNWGNTTYYRNGVNKDGNTKEVSSFADVTAEGGTQLYHGIEHGLELFSDNSNTKKILVILNDGAADDSESADLSAKLINFKENNTIFTVGFAHDGDNLAEIAGGPGGQYLYASNETDLIHAMADIQQAITAMLVDPMGPAVGFETGSIHINSNLNYVDGDVAYENNTLYWNPSNDNSSIANKTIEYSYTVTLNEEGKAQPGLFDGVDLNKPTELIYGIRDPETGAVSNTKKSNFPIPKASYAIASLQVKCQYNGEDIAPELTDTAITDYGTPAFDLDVENPVERLIHKSGNHYYVFDESEKIIYKINGSSRDANGNPYTADDMVPFSYNGEEYDTNQYEVIFPYMLTELEEVRTVSYKFVGDVLPPDANTLRPSDASYLKDETVDVAENLVSTDPVYMFNGWQEESGKIIIEDGKFSMPDRDVVLVGSWTVKQNRTVTYSYANTPPDGAPALPARQTYRTEDTVTVFSVSNVTGYTFSGWSMATGNGDEMVTVGSTFTMPDWDVELVGSWEITPSYQVIVNYYTKTDGITAETPDHTITEDLQYADGNQTYDFEYSTQWQDQTYGDSRSLVDNSETSATFVEGKNKLTGITPATPTNVVTINLYREVTTSVPYRVVHEYYVVEPDGTTKTLEYTDGEDSAPLIAAHGKLVSTEQNEANTNILANKVTQRTDEDSTKTYSYVGSDPQSDKVNGLRLDKKTPTENQPQTITLKYERKTYSVTITGDSGVASVVNTDTATLQENAASVQQAYIYDEGSKVDVSYTLKDGYRVKAVTVTDGTNAVSESLYTIEGQKISFENLRGNYAVTVETEQIPTYTVTIHYVSENQDKAVLTYSDYISDSALEGSAYDVRDKLLKKIEKDGKTWYYSGVSGDAISGTLNGDKEITVKYYLKPTYTITATYTTVTDGESASVTKTAPVTTGEPGSVIPFDQKDYDNKVDGFTADHFQNGLKVNDEEVTEMPKMKKFGAYEVTLSYRRTVNNPYQAVVRYQDKNNAELQEPETSNKIAFGQPYNMKYAKLETITLADGTQYAFVSDDTDENHTDYTGIMPKGGVEITRTYEKLPSYQVVANYYTKTDGGEYQLDNTSPVIAKDVTYGKESGEAKFSSIYKDNSYSQPQLVQPQDGVTIEDNMVKGITPATPTNVVTINLYRTVNNPYQAVVRYQDKNNAELQEPETSNKIAFGQPYNMKYAELETITLADGTQYAFVSDDTDENHTDYTGIMPKGGVEITRIYEKLPSYQVIVNYYTITDGETPVLDNTITNAITYTKDEGTYQCETTKANNQYGDAELSSGNAQLDAATALLTKIVPTDTTNVITINLYRTVQTPAQYQVSHQYYEVDLNDNRTLVSADSYTTDPVTMNHGDTVAASGLTTDPDGKTDAVTYTEVSRTPESLTLSKKGIQTITITYERYQAPITVHYVDTEGTPLMDDYTETLFAGDAYDLNTPVVQIIEILKDGVPYDFAYDDTDDDTGYAGVLPKGGVEITLVYQKRGKATATVQYVDEDGNALQLPLMTEEMYIGEPYDVSEALQVQQITLGGSEYAFDHHFQTRAPLRSVGSLTFVEDVDYQGAMPPGGIQITRVYRLGKVTYYYQQKNVYTAYDADGNVVYSGTQEFPILTSEVAIATLNALESFEYEGYGFWRVSEETMTADLTGTAPDKPYVFIVYYEFRQGDEPVPDTQLPPGITAPESTLQPTATAPVDTLPPQTGDEGVALWQWLMVLASAGLVLMLKAQRKTRREER